MLQTPSRPNPPATTDRRPAAGRWISLAATGVILLGSPGAWAAPQHPTTATTLSPGATAQRKDPLSYFVTQFRSEFNPGAGKGSNGNCGPACVLMAARAYERVTVTSATVSHQLRLTRLAATGRQNPDEATSVAQLAKGARHYGLTATPAFKGSVDALTRHVQAGGMAITCIVPGFIDPSYRSRGHYVLVRSIDGKSVQISDPGRGIAFGGIRSVPMAAFIKAWEATGYRVTLVGPPDQAAQKALPRS